MQYAYKIGQREVSLTPDDDTVAFRAGRTATATLRRRLADHVADAVPVRGRGLTLLQLHESSSRDHVRGVIADHRTARHHAPVFKVGGHHLVAGGEVLVRFRDGARVEPILRKARLSTIDHLGNLYELAHAEGRPFDIARDLLEHPDVVWAEPHFTSVHHRPHLLAARSRSGRSRPEPPPAGYEIAHTRATEAWAIQTGDPEVLVAVIDEGIQKTHPSLRSIVADTYDATKDRTRQRPNPWDFHGTACAGLAAAAPDSGPIRGFGGGCGLLCAKMGYT
ncbi:MAG: S8 family serine peptidase, partial [Gemmatimonadetes bacterium]|nr:S8 family serine peptidase [Gemmatimonadota bacterium]